MKKISISLFTVMSLLPFLTEAQSQLVLLKGERVVKRYRAGDDFVFRIKGSKSVRRSYVNKLSDTSVVIHRDTIPFRRIERLYFRQITFYNTIGTVLLVGGTGYFLIDQFNVGVVQGDGFSLDDRVTRSSVTAIGLGLPLVLIKKKSQKVDGRVRLRTVKPGSVFYQSDPDGFETPFIEN